MYSSSPHVWLPEWRGQGKGWGERGRAEIYGEPVPENRLFFHLWPHPTPGPPGRSILRIPHCWILLGLAETLGGLAF